MEESSNSIVESRQELTISPTTHANPTSRTAHFLKPSIDPNFQPISSLSLPSLPLPRTFDPQNWPLTVNFLGWKNPPTNWKEWVHQMASLHAPTWKKAGIYDAIFNSTYRFDKHDELLLGVAERWCPDTNSFIFPWGEATVTLEDMLIAGFSVLGSPVFRPLQPEEAGAIEEALILEKREMNRTPAKKALQSSWLKIFMDSGSQIEHEAFLSLWLSRFVFPTSRDVICECVFPIAIHLARGTRIALAPAVLATIYRDLSLLKLKMAALTTLDADEKLVATTYAPFRLVLAWVWERFVHLSPKPNLLKIGEPRFARWNNVKCNIKNVRSLFDSSKESFIWRPYAKTVENWDMPKFYREKELWVSPDSGVDEDILSFIMCLRVSELVGLESGCIEQYLPQRVARQFGFDQDVPGFVDQCNATHEDAWDCYIRPVTGIECYVPSCLFEGEVTNRYLEWWNHSVSVQHQEKTSDVTPKLPIEKEKGQETFSSSLISLKTLQTKRAASELNVAKISAKGSKRTKKGEGSRIPIGKKAAGELNRLEASAKGSEIMKKGEVSNSEIRKKAERKLKGLKVSTESMKKRARKKSAGELDGLKVSAKSSERIKIGDASNDAAIKTAAIELKESKVLANSPESMKEGETISSFKVTPKTTKEEINGEALVPHVNRAMQSEISAESSKIMNKESNKPAMGLVTEINEFLIPPGFAAENGTGKAGDPSADDSITMTEMMKCKKKHNAKAGNKQCAGDQQLAYKLDSLLSPVASDECVKTSDVTISDSEVRQEQNEAIENEKDGDNKTVCSQTQSYSSSPADDDSLKGFNEEKLKASEACEIMQTRSNGNVSDQSHLSANERSPNVLASKEKVKHSTASGSVVNTGDKAVAQFGGFYGHAESEPLEVFEPTPVVETVMLCEGTEYLENVDHGYSILSENSKALKVAKSATSMEKVELSKEAEEGQENDLENGQRQFDQSESHSSSAAGNETPKYPDVPEKVMLTETGSLTDSNSSKGNAAHNGNKGSKRYSADARKLMLEAQIEKLGKIMAERFRDICGE